MACHTPITLNDAIEVRRAFVRTSTLASLTARKRNTNVNRRSSVPVLVLLISVFLLFFFLASFENYHKNLKVQTKTYFVRVCPPHTPASYVIHRGKCVPLEISHSAVVSLSHVNSLPIIFSPQSESQSNGSVNTEIPGPARVHRSGTKKNMVYSLLINTAEICEYISLSIT